MLRKRYSSLGAFIAFLASLFLFLLATWIILNRQYVVDQLNVWQYKPTPEIITVVSRASMSDQGKFYFYASDPSVDTAADFNTNCRRQEPQNAILGCYTNKKIYVYAVTNSQLDGIEEVTAAHETLHAIWDRMSDADRRSVGILLDQAYAKINDQDLKDRMDYYVRNEPDERLNELHSILGTEYSNLGNDLEAHYAKYFIDRTKVVSFHSSYQALFNDLRSQSEVLLKDLQTLRADLDSTIAQYNSDAASLQNDYNALIGRAGSVDLTSVKQVNQYNAELASLKTQADKLDKSKAEILTEQSTYNTKVEQYNKLIVASNNLVKSLDSTLEPSPSL